MPAYKVTYFGIKGLGESIRFLLSYGGVDFVDERLDEKGWAQLKPTLEFGQLPILEVDGKKINQSSAICRYLAKQFGLAGKNDWEALEIDATVDNITDFRIKVLSPHYEKNEAVKAEKLEAAKEAMKFYITRFDAQVKKNGGYFVGGKLSWADIVFVSLLDTLKFRSGYDVIEKAENLKALRDKVLAVPSIKAWVAKRPKTDM